MSEGYSRRVERKKVERKIIYVVCEGKTEKNYFEKFRTRRNGLNIIVKTCGKTNAKGIISFAKYQKKEIDFNTEKDSIWCAFDSDLNKRLDELCRGALRDGINIAMSNPCIELWFLLHFKEIYAPLECKTANQKLEMFMFKYKKGSLKIEEFKNMNKNLNLAIKRAKKLNQKHKKSKHPIYSKMSNPASQIFQLVEEIKKAN